MADKRKNGAISANDRRYILENSNTMSAEQIAENLGKNPKIIEREIKNYVSLPQAENNTIRWHLKQSPDWKHLRGQFTPEELVLIENKYVKYIEQMKDDIVATEETQIINMIKIEILMDRNLKGKMKLHENIRQFEAQKEAIMDRVEGDFALLSDEQNEQITEINGLISSSRNVESARTSEYIELQKEFNTLSTKLKASRDQRVDRVLDARFSFTTYVKDLMNRDKQEKESRFVELYSKSVDKEEDRLITAHKYADGSYDNPILSVEILEKLDKRDVQVITMEDFNVGSNS